MRYDLNRLISTESSINSRLTGNTINYYLKFLSFMISVNNNNKKEILVFDSSFFEEFLEGHINYNFRYIEIDNLNFKHENIFNFKKVLIPIFFLEHSSLVVIDLNLKSCSYYDSFHSLLNYQDREYKVSSFIENIIRHDSIKYYDVSAQSKPFKYHVEEVPQQENDHDCGVYTCAFAKWVCLNLNINLTQSDINIFRKIMADL